MTLPREVVKIAEDIKNMKIRGAGRIARAAAEALKLAALSYSEEFGDFIEYMENVGEFLISTRPTAVSLPNAVTLILNRVKREPQKTVRELVELAVSTAEEFIKYSKIAVKRIGEIGARRIVDGETVLTHCNSSAAISVLLEAKKMGREVLVYATETRPKYQGYITARILSKNGIDVTLIPDSAVRHVMKKVDKVVVGADTVAANGAVVNKVGTSQIALAAHEARVRVFVASETYKFSPKTLTGELVMIEERSPLEVVDEKFLAENSRVKVRNPAFDVTPPEYIDAIITEYGIIPPQAAILILKEVIGWAISSVGLEGPISISEEDSVVESLKT